MKTLLTSLLLLLAIASSAQKSSVTYSNNVTAPTYEVDTVLTFRDNMHVAGVSYDEGARYSGGEIVGIALAGVGGVMSLSGFIDACVGAHKLKVL